VSGEVVEVNEDLKNETGKVRRCGGAGAGGGGARAVGRPLSSAGAALPACQFRQLRGVLQTHSRGHAGAWPALPIGSSPRLWPAVGQRPPRHHVLPLTRGPPLPPRPPRAQLNQDPYGAGWLIKVKISNKGELDSLLDAAAYEKHSEH
jgi:hypothetical protein